MDPGIIALAGIFVLAALLLAGSIARGRATARKLVEAGFTRCDAEAPALAAALAEVMGGHPPAPRRIHQLGRCFKRPGGWGHIYHLGVVDRTHADDAGVGTEHQATGGRFDLYLLDLPDPGRVASGPVSVFFCPRAPRPLQLLLEKLVRSDPRGVPLEIAKSVHTQSFIAAFGAEPGKLDERLPAATQERLARAAALGFLSAHFGAGKLALAAAPDRPDVQQQLAYVGEWA
jgi:hypothetical protein